MSNIEMVSGAVAIGGFLCVVALNVVAERIRLNTIRGSLFRGGASKFDSDPSSLCAAFKRLGLLEKLPNAARGVRWSAKFDRQGIPVELVEHCYVNGFARFRSVRRRIIASVRVPGDWPPLVVSSEHQLFLVDTSAWKKGLRLDNDDFDRRWRTQAYDENFGIAFLTPSVQAWCMSLPKGAIIHVGLGVMSVSTLGHIEPGELASFASLPAKLLEALPEELLAEMEASTA